MCIEQILKTLKNLLPETSDDEFLEQLALQSSYIIFDSADEILFKPGDAPKGFYWVLSGQVVEKVSKDVSVLLGKGSMIGLEEFLKHQQHVSTWSTCCRTETLFIDSRCFQNMDKNSVINKKMKEELVNHLLRLKEACQPNPRVLINSV